MVGPQNNLAEVLRTYSANTSVSTHGGSFSPNPAATSATGKRSKFKPAISNAHAPNTTTGAPPRKQPSTHLPSFSTAGFQYTSGNKGGNASNPRTNMYENTSTVEFKSTTPVGRNGAKRTSSDPSVLADPSPQSLKKLKQTKENLDAEHPAQNYLRYNAAEGSGHQNKPITLNSLPATKDRKSEKEASLLNESERTLDGFLTHCLGLHRLISNQLRNPGHGDKQKDTAVIDDILTVLDNRINALEKALEVKRGGGISIALGPTMQSKETEDMPTPSPQEPRELTCSSKTLQSSTATETVFNSSKIMPWEDSTQTADDDTKYWDGLPDMDMFHDDPSDIGGPSGSSAFPPVVATNAAPDTSSFADLTKTSFYPEIMHALRDVFGLQGFRTNQLEAITSTLRGHDVFVLMPTGGGKSLCYQLPAVCRAGKTKGLTVVVTPLLALMQDQVAALRKKNVDAFLWNSDTPPEDVSRFLYEEKHEAALLYITPEKLKESSRLKTSLSVLHRKNELARFVVDEAHCISSWGQDFREAYMNLGALRTEYPGVPIMALTATADPNTIKDIKHQLHIPECKFYKQSFNRPNLRYIIKEKNGGTVVQDIINYIRSEHFGDSGVIYCTGRDTCEKVAQKLQEDGLRATYYHAKVESEVKSATLTDWKNGKVDIIVATIAFGMGIDKADVRFVIHHDLAKSLSGYYQETGRAGRDGKPADCVLYYRFQDFKTICRMIESPKDREANISRESIDRQIEAARDVLKYCEDKSVCRRVQLLQFFGENFDKRDCANGCDNCADTRETVREDVTILARNAIMVVQSLIDKGESITLSQLQNILRGANIADIRVKEHDRLELYGSAKDVPKELLEQTLRHLLHQIHVFEKFSRVNTAGFHTEYIKLGANAKSLVKPAYKLEIDWRRNTKHPRKPRKKAIPTGTPNQSTSVGSKGKRRAAMEIEDDIELFDDDPIIYEAPPYEDVVETSDVSRDPETLLYRRMETLCRRIVEPADRHILDDLTLQYISALCPRDYVGFKNTLSDALQDTMDDDRERKRVVDDINRKYGQQLLNLCIEHGVKRQDQHAPPPPKPVIDANWRLQYEYNVSSTESSSSVTRRRKFKPA